VARQLGFAAANFWVRFRSTPRRTAPDTAFNDVATFFTARGVAQALRGIPVTANDIDATPENLLDGYFMYAKIWLRTYAPAVSVDRHELEINTRFALSLPVAFAGVATTRTIMTNIHGPVTAFVIIGVLVLAVGLALFVLLRGIEARRWEGFDALRNYVAAWHVLNNPPPNDTIITAAGLTTAERRPRRADVRMGSRRR
jgi:hypothetical protein